MLLALSVVVGAAEQREQGGDLPSQPGGHPSRWVQHCFLGDCPRAVQGLVPPSLMSSLEDDSLEALRVASVAQVPKPEVLELTARAKDSAAAQMAVKLYETAVSGGDVGGIKPYVHTLPSLEHNVQLICCSIGCLFSTISCNA